MSPRHVSALGALVTVASLAIDPFVQQVASYRLNILTTHEPTSLPVRLDLKTIMGLIKQQPTRHYTILVLLHKPPRIASETVPGDLTRRWQCAASAQTFPTWSAHQSQFQLTVSVISRLTQNASGRFRMD